MPLPVALAGSVMPPGDGLPPLLPLPLPLLPLPLSLVPLTATVVCTWLVASTLPEASRETSVMHVARPISSAALAKASAYLQRGKHERGLA